MADVSGSTFNAESLSTYGDSWFDNLISSLVVLLDALLEGLKSLVFWFWENLMASLKVTGDLAVSAMPDLSEFCGDCLIVPAAISDGSQFISTGFFGFSRWVLPIDAMICLIAIISTTTLMYFTIIPVLRWLKVAK